MRRWVASVLLLALVAFALTPSRIAPWFGGERPSSVAFAPTKQAAQKCCVERTGPLRVAPPPCRVELGDLPRLGVLTPFATRSFQSVVAGLAPETWRCDQRESIRRVCPRFAPPESPSAPPSV